MSAYGSAPYGSVPYGGTLVLGDPLEPWAPPAGPSIYGSAVYGGFAYGSGVRPRAVSSMPTLFFVQVRPLADVDPIFRVDIRDL